MLRFDVLLTLTKEEILDGLHRALSRFYFISDRKRRTKLYKFRCNRKAFTDIFVTAHSDLHTVAPTRKNVSLVGNSLHGSRVLALLYLLHELTLKLSVLSVLVS